MLDHKLNLSLSAAPIAGLTKLIRIVCMTLILITLITLASDEIAPEPYLSSGHAAAERSWSRPEPPPAPPLVTPPPFALKWELLILAILWLGHSFRLRAIAGRIRQSAASARLNERERIARELHDTFLQGVQGLMLRLHAAAECVETAPKQAHLLIEQALVRADAVLEEGRDRVNGLRTIDKTRHDLSQTFLRVAEEAQPNPTKVRITVEGAMRELRPGVREETERIGIEAMTNALLHAKSSTIDVEIIFQRRQLALRISDDGIGIDPSIMNVGRERHFGLTGMKERARGIRGQFSIASRPGGGTEIELVISATIAYMAGRRELPQWWHKKLPTARERT